MGGMYINFFLFFNMYSVYKLPNKLTQLHYLGVTETYQDGTSESGKQDIAQLYNFFVLIFSSFKHFKSLGPPA